MHKYFDAAEPDLPVSSLVDARRQLRLNVAAIQESGARRGQAWSFPQFGAWWKPAAAVALLTAGFLAGRGLPGEGNSGSFRISGSDPTATRVRFVQPNGAGRVQIMVEEVRQRVLEGGLQDNRIRSLLVAATREANDPGVRVETLDLLKAQSGSSSEVRRALLSALQNDPNPGVRLKALEALRGVTDGETRRVLGQVLLTRGTAGADFARGE